MQCVCDEGLEAVFERHRTAHAELATGLAQLDLAFAVEAPFRLPMLNAVSIPAGIDESRVRKSLLLDHGIEIGAGLGPLAGKIWRVGLMGHTARTANVERLLAALQKVLRA